jgi:uncharacterized protein
MSNISPAIPIETRTSGPLPPLVGYVPVTTKALSASDQAEVLDFLSARPLHNIVMAGLIRDNGLVSPHNRGTFYGCRNSTGGLEGVALIGHATLIEARTGRALREFAFLAQASMRTHMIVGEQEELEQFWNYYADEGQEMRLVCRELLFELRQPLPLKKEMPGLRLATTDDLEAVVPVQAEMAFVESGVNPLEVDPEGFRQRCARRIMLGRTWVLVEDGRLVFKAEVQAETPDIIYLEGVYVHPCERGRGQGAELSRAAWPDSPAKGQCHLPARQRAEQGGARLLS